MALGKNPLLVLGALAGVAALYQGYNVYNDKQNVNILEERKETVIKKLETAHAAEKTREEAGARQSGMENLKAADAPNARAGSSAGAAKPAKPTDGKASVATSSPATPPPNREQLAAENAHLLAMLNGDNSRSGSIKAGEPVRAPAKPEMRNAERVQSEDAPEKPVPAPNKKKAPTRVEKLPARAQILAELKRDAELGLGSFTAKWADKYGSSSWSELVAIAGDSAQDLGLRYFSLQAALEIGGRDSADGVAGLLKDKNPGIRCLSLLGLGEMGDQALAPKLIPLLKDRAMVVRECALTATVRAQGQKSLGQVLGMISDPVNYNRGHPLSIVKRGFELLNAMGASSSLAEACLGLKNRTSPTLYRETAKRWSICTQSVEGSLTPTSAGR